jgi:hypothetical protein
MFQWLGSGGMCPLVFKFEPRAGRANLLERGIYAASSFKRPAMLKQPDARSIK